MSDPIKLHDLRPSKGANTAKTRVGRGEASKGKTAGRGTKGTKARKNVPAYFEGGQMPLQMRLPKLKGFKNPAKVVFQVVNVDELATAFPKGGDVTAADIVAAGLVRANQPVKVLGDGGSPWHSTCPRRSSRSLPRRRSRLPAALSPRPSSSPS